MKDIRYVIKKLEKDGYYFEIASSKDVPQLLPQLKAVSDAWLNKKNTAEKRF